MHGEWARVAWAVAAGVLCSLPGGALGSPLRAQMAWCEIFPEGTGQNNAHEPFGATAGKRKMRLRFSFAADPGSNDVLEDAEIAAALAETASVEVCSIQAPLIGTGLPVIHCPWSEALPGGENWLVYGSAGPPPPNDLFDSLVTPLPDRIEPWGATTALEYGSFVPADWLSLQNHGLILFFRTRTADDTAALPTYWGSSGVQGIVGDIVTGGDGFCAVPTPLPSWTSWTDPVTNDTWFRALGIPLDRFADGQGGLYRNPFYWFNLDPCTDGSAAPDRVQSDFGAPPNACVDPLMAQWTTARLAIFEDWQRRYLHGVAAYAEPTWAWGSGGDCVGPCPTHVVFQQHEAGSGGFFANARLSFPLWHDWLDPIVDPRQGSLGYTLFIAAHEYHHQFADNGWRREHGVDWDGSYPSGPPLFHVDTNTFAKAVCFKEAWMADSDPCVSATRLRRNELTLLPWEANAYLEDPRQMHLHTLEQSWLFFRYAMEQFSVPISWGTPAHPGGQNAHDDLRWLEPQRPLGDYRRRPDEGADLLGHVFEGYLHADNQNKPADQATGFGLEQALHRSLRSLMLDYHTAIALKDYADRPNYESDPRWRLEWVGSSTVGGPAVFPDNAPPVLGDYFTGLSTSTAALPATMAAIKAQSGGRLEHLGDPLAVGPFDDLRRARRLRDDWNFVTQGPIILHAGDPPIGTSTPVVVPPYGAAILSAYVDRSDPLDWLMRVRIQAEGADPEALRVRIFTIDGSGVPHLRSACQWMGPTCPGSDCTERCPFQMSVDEQGELTIAVEETIQVKRGGILPTDIDEVIVVVSAGRSPGSFTWIMGDSQPYIEILEPTQAHPAPIGHAKLPLANPAGAQPFLLRFRIANEDNEPIVVASSAIELEIPDCPGGAYQLQPGDYTLHRFDPAEYWAVVTVPYDCYSSATIPGSNPDLAIRVSAPAGSLSASEEDALDVSTHWPRVAMQLVLDKSGSMTEDKLQAAKIAGQLLIEALADDDAVGVVSFEEDAFTNRELLSNCSGTRQHAIDALWNVGSVACGRTSLGDGLFEAQANFAAQFDQPSSYWDGTVAACKPDTHAMVVLSDGHNNEPYEPRDYYELGDPEPWPSHDGPLAFQLCPVDTLDDDFSQGGWLRYHDRVNKHLQVPILGAVAFGEDADLVELQKLLAGTSGGSVTYLEGPGDDSFATQMRMTVELSDRFRQSASAASGHERAGAWAAASVHQADMPVIEVEPLTQELLVSVSSARDDTSQLELVTPSGENVAPVQADPRATVFRVADPEPGTWLWKIVKAPAPGGPPAVFVEHALRGPLRLHAMADVTHPWPVPSGGGPYEDGRLAGSEITIRALPTTGAPILDAVVIAEVRIPGGLDKVLELYDDGAHGDAGPGDGIYGARFSDTLAAGVYAMRVIASGISPLSGAPFTREKSLALYLHDGDDKDRDELPDWWEKKHAGGLTKLSADGDADQDGLPDLGEYEQDLSPVLGDSDGGGEADGSEIAAGRDPRDPADDAADVFQPSVAPGSGKALIDLRIPFLLVATAELQRASAPEGPFATVFSGTPPADGIVADAAPNDVRACYRLRTLTARARSDWSAPLCVVPRIDPLPPRLSLELDRSRLGGPFVTRRDSEITLQLDASDAPPRIFASEVRGAYLLGEGAGYELLDPEVGDSGVTDMMVSLKGTFEGAAWEPLRSEVTLAAAADDYFVVYVKVRDGAGNESRTAYLPVRVEDDWPAGYALVGLRSLLVEHQSSVSGGLAVVEAGDEADAWELVLAHGVAVEGPVRADGVLLMPDAEVNGSIYSNELSLGGVLAGEHVSPVMVPIYLRLPRSPEVAPGQLDVAVEGGEERYLEPGAYRDWTLAGGSAAEPAVLVLAGGRYQLDSLRAGKNARIACAAPCELAVRSGLWLDKESYLGPEGDGAPSRDVGVFVAGTGGDEEDAVRIGKDGRVSARIFAPEGRLRLGHGAIATGAFVAAHVRVGHGAQVRLAR